jgi:two-component system, chemotaxis family, protein-glutamate methylesterase/glutaminase
MNKIIVVGASAGGVAALQRLVAELPADLRAPILVVLHVGAHASVLPELLSAKGPLPASHGQDGQVPQPGRIYIAPPDHHMLLIHDEIKLNRGPKEHHHRPAVDPLFLSAALSHGAAVIGVILTGRLDDGTFGLQAIKRCGGTAVVQDPVDAAEPSMPLSALEHVEVDHSVGLAGMAALLSSLASAPSSAAGVQGDKRLEHEHALMLFQGDAMEHLAAVGKPSPFVCPDCRGGLWEMADSRPTRYRCHTGHAFTIRTLQHALWSAADDSVWTALRALQEKGVVIRHMASLAKQKGDARRADQLEAVAQAIDGQSRQLHDLMEQAPEPVE